MKNRPLDVTLTNFDIEYYKGTGSPSVYASNLVVQENGKEIARKRIVVNDPTRYQATALLSSVRGE